MEVLISILILGLVLGGLLSPLFKRRRGGSKGEIPARSPIREASQHKLYTLKASSPRQETQISENDFSYEDEYRAATARQRVWIQYEDNSGNISERKIEVYHPEDDDFVFAWCCSRQEPRTFSRHRILAWRLLPEQFEQDPIVERYWREEGTRDQRDRVPWRRWIDGLGPELTARYRRLYEQASSSDLSSSYSRQDSIPTASSVEGPRWWELRDKALITYSKINSSSLADYEEVIRLATSAINGGASASAQARLYRVLGEHCGQTKDTIENFERAIKLDPGVGAKKLLARLKGSKD
jgi:hypothetical protein